MLQRPSVWLLVSTAASPSPAGAPKRLHATLTVMWDPGEATMPPELDLHDLAVWHAKNTAWQLRDPRDFAFAVPLDAEPAPGNPDDHEHWARCLEDSLKQDWKQASERLQTRTDWAWVARDLRFTEAVNSDTPEWLGHLVPWTLYNAISGFASIVPAVGAALSLNWILSIPADTGAAGCVVLPVFSGHEFFNSGPLADGWTLRRDGFLLAQYATPPGRSALYVISSPIEPAPNDPSRWHNATRWLRASAAPIERLASVDPQAALHAAVSEALHTPRHLHTILSDTTLTPPSWSNLDSALDALLPRLNPGWVEASPTPDIPPLWAAIFNAWRRASGARPEDTEPLRLLDRLRTLWTLASASTPQQLLTEAAWRTIVIDAASGSEQSPSEDKGLLSDRDRALRILENLLGGKAGQEATKARVAVLRRTLIECEKAVVKSSPTAPTPFQQIFREPIGLAVAAELLSFPVSAIQAQAHSSPALAEIRGCPDEHPDRCARSVLARHITRALKPVLPANTDPDSFAQITLNNALARLDSPSTDEVDGPGSARPAADPLVIPALRPIREENVATGDLRHLAGFACLVRRSAPEPTDWFPLHIAEVEVRDSTASPERSPLHESKTPVLAPTRFPFFDGFANPTFEYENEPLAVFNESNRQDGEGVSVTTDDDKWLPPRTRLRTAPAKLSHLPVLQFGATYEAVSFGVEASGELPEELRTHSPWLPAYRVTHAALGDIPRHCARKLRYLRRTPVSCFGLATEARRTPPLPPGVRPLAAEIPYCSAITNNETRIFDYDLFAARGRFYASAAQLQLELHRVEVPNGASLKLILTAQAAPHTSAANPIPATDSTFTLTLQGPIPPSRLSVACIDKNGSSAAVAALWSVSTGGVLHELDFETYNPPAQGTAPLYWSLSAQASCSCPECPSLSPPAWSLSAPPDPATIPDRNAERAAKTKGGSPFPPAPELVFLQDDERGPRGSNIFPTELRWPSVDKTTHDRCVGRSPTLAPDEHAEDASVPDDPFVSGYRVVVTEYFRFTDTVPRFMAASFAKKVDFPYLLGQTRRTPLTCVRSPSASAPVFGRKSDALEIDLPAGGLYHIRIEPVLSHADKFHPQLVSRTNGTGDALTSIDRFGPALEYLVETEPTAAQHQAAFPNRSQAFEAFFLEWRGREVVAGTRFQDRARDPLKLDPLRAACVGHVRIGLEQWAWRGEPVRLPGDDPETNDRWFPADAVEESRSELHPRLERFEVRTMTTSPLLTFISECEAPATFGVIETPALREDVSSRTAGAYYRAYVTLVSRYARTPHKPSRELTTDPDNRTHQHYITTRPSLLDPNASFDANAKTWKRCYVPYRGSPDLAAPRVKMVLPLMDHVVEPESGTRAGNPRRFPAALVVLDEPWFRVGGPDETLEANVCITRRKLLPTTLGKDGDQKTSDERLHVAHYEIARDPGLSEATRVPLTLDPSGSPFEREAPRLRVFGPLGHTFDSLSGAGQMIYSTSAVIALEPDEAWDPQGEDDDWQAWYFAKIELRRTVTGPSGSPFNSAWTKPVWVQFPPALAQSAHLDLSANATWVRVNPSGEQSLSFAGCGDAVCSAEKHRYSVWAVLTDLVRSTSDGEEERFIDMGLLSSDGNPAGNALCGLLGERLLVATSGHPGIRTVVVQHTHDEDIKALKGNPSPLQRQALWEQLALHEIPGDKRVPECHARIVSVSPRRSIPMPGGSTRKQSPASAP